MNPEYLGLRSISWKYLFRYFSASRSIFRMYQDLFLEQEGKDLKGKVIEIGGELSYSYKKYFPLADEYVVTNINRDYEHYLSITDITFPDNSQDVYVCTSVLEHVYEAQKGMSEMIRTIKPGGHIIITIPFAYPIHDEVDYWRMTPDTFRTALKDFDIVRMCHLGGKFSALTEEFQRPKNKMSLRLFVYKWIGAWSFILGKLIETKDNFPCGFAVHAVKKQNA
jgi:SAM-dependent methyltransferase